MLLNFLADRELNVSWLWDDRKLNVSWLWDDREQNVSWLWDDRELLVRCVAEHVKRTGITINVDMPIPNFIKPQEALEWKKNRTDRRTDTTSLL